MAKEQKSGGLGREAVLGFLSQDPASKRRRVDVPEWGGAVYVNVLTGTRYREWLDARAPLFGDDVRTDPLNNQRIQALFLVFVVTDEQGQPLFHPEDVEMMVAVPLDQQSILLRIGDVAADINGLKAPPQAVGKP